MKVGDRVSAVIYGERLVGVVSRMRRPDANIVWVQWDGRNHEDWTFAVSLAPEVTP